MKASGSPRARLMISLGKEIDYAMICLAHLAASPEQVWSARQIADQHQLPVAQLMNVLKRLHRRGVLQSTRGARGGYRLGTSLDAISAFELIQMVGRGPATSCTCGEEHPDDLGRRRAMHVPMQALQYQVVRFLKSVSLADLVIPGRRIDVPRELLDEQCSCRKTRRNKIQPTDLVLDLSNSTTSTV